MKTNGTAVKQAIKENKFEGLDSNASKFSTGFTLGCCDSDSVKIGDGPYSSVEQFNFRVDDGKQAGKYASAIIVKDAKTNKYEVLTMSIYENGKWVNLKPL